MTLAAGLDLAAKLAGGVEHTERERARIKVGDLVYTAVWAERRIVPAVVLLVAHEAGHATVRRCGLNDSNRPFNRTLRPLSQLVRLGDSALAGIFADWLRDRGHEQAANELQAHWMPLGEVK